MNQLSDFVHSLSEKAPKTARGRRTWQKLLDSAEKEFGDRGFHEAAINRIGHFMSIFKARRRSSGRSSPIWAT